MREPNFFFVGAPKCGTTALYEMIGSHPDVYVSQVKEPDYFAADLIAAAPRRPASAVTDEAQYLRLFTGADSCRAVGEGSVSYLASRRAPESIRARYPDARVIMVLRDPAARLFAHYTAARAARVTRVPFSSWFAERRRDTGEMVRFGPIEAGRYAAHLQRYLAHFERSRIHVVWHGDYVRDPARTLCDVFAFLGVDPHHPVDVRIRRNETPAPRWPRAWFHLPVRDRMTEGDRALAIREYEADIVALAGLTARSLGPWLDVSPGAITCSP